MTKEAKKIFYEEIKNFIENYYSLDTYEPLDEEGDVRTLETFNSFSERVFYEDYRDRETLQQKFCQFLMDNCYSYYSQIVEILVSAGYQKTKPNGKEWETEKVENLFGFGMFSAFKNLLKKSGCEDAIYNIVTCREAKKPYKIRFEGGF